MMDVYADIEDYKSAATIAMCLVDNMTKNDVNYERYLKEAGIWLSQTDDKKAALKVLNKYLEAYDDGEFNAEIRVAKDSLFFTNIDENATTKLQNYEKLISKYQDDTIGSKAIYEKAKLLLELKMYNDVLAMQDTLYKLDTTKYKDIDNIINDSAIGSMENALKNKELTIIIDLSGKQRMLTQKMTKEAFLIKLGIDKESNIKKLKQSSRLFDKTLKGFQRVKKSLLLITFSSGI
jgi:hypothetical protein